MAFLHVGMPTYSIASDDHSKLNMRDVVRIFLFPFSSTPLGNVVLAYVPGASKKIPAVTESARTVPRSSRRLS